MFIFRKKKTSVYYQFFCGLNFAFFSIAFLGFNQAFSQDLITPSKPSSISTNEIEKIDCRVTFTKGSDQFDEKQLTECLRRTDKKNIVSVDIFSFAFPEGTPQQNKKIAEERATSVEKRIKKIFPKAQFSIRQGGFSKSLIPTGIVVMTAKREQPPTATGAQPKSNTGNALQETKSEPSKTALPVCSKCPICPDPLPINPQEMRRVSLWTGVQFLLFPEPLSTYTGSQVLAFQFGFSYNLFQFLKKYEIYNQVIVDFGNSKQTLNVDNYGPYKSFYAFSNFSILAGVNYTILNEGPLLFAFLEAGPVIEMRNFSISSSNTTRFFNESFSVITVGLSTNIGAQMSFKIKSTSTENIEAFLRAHINLSVSPENNKSLIYSNRTDTVNVTPFSLAPGVSIGLKF